MAIVPVTDDLGVLAPDDLHARQVSAAIGLGQYRPRDGRAAGIAKAALGVAQVDDAVVAVIRMQGNIAEATLAPVGNIRYAVDRIGPLSLAGDDEQIALLFRHEHAPVRQESKRPGLVERRHGFYVKR